MKRKLIVSLIVACATAVSAAEPPAVRSVSAPGKTTVPFTYCMHYIPANGLPGYEDESLLDSLRSSPPDLLHIFYNIPFKGGLGPTYGCELFSNDILTPGQVPKEIERVKREIANLRATGIDRLIPYVYIMAFFGHPDKRTGFFNFYDHWDDYRAFGLGPKPAADPSLWSQVRGPQPLGGGPPDALHYDPCINHPAWSEYLDLVVRQIAEVGYDGMFCDVNTLYCYCPYCQERFDIDLLDKYGMEGLRKVFGTADHRELNISTVYRDFERTVLGAFEAYLTGVWDTKLAGMLGATDPSQVKLNDDWRLLRSFMQGSLGEFPPQDNFENELTERFGAAEPDAVPEEERDSFIQTVLRRHFQKFLESDTLAESLLSRFGSSDIMRRSCSDPRDLLLWVETQRFWTRSMARTHARLKRVGRTAFARLGRGDDFHTTSNIGSVATLDGLNKRRVNGIDLVGWESTSDILLFEEMHRSGSLESGVIFSNIFAFRWAMAAGTRAAPLLYGASEDRAADLAEAEVAAGGGGAFIQPGTGAHESRRRWRPFFEEHAELWDDGRSAAQVALLFWSDQVYYEFPKHLAAVHRLVKVVSENQIPFDIVTEVGIESLAQYETVIAPMLRYVQEPQIDALLEYAERGGNLVIVEPFGTEDEYARPRQTDPLASVCPPGAEFQCRDHGQGKILRLDDKLVPLRRSDFWNLMEERANVLSLARDFLNQARREDIRDGVDLGERFIQRLEESLGEPLRWSPADTDDGVYIHPYRLPARPGHPERIVVHAVNYRLPIRSASEPVVATDIRITVPLSPGEKVKAVRAIGPTEESGVIPWEEIEDGILMTVPELKIYKALTIDLEM